MPNLWAISHIGSKRAGFVVPVFRAVAGANYSLVQVGNNSNRVSAFRSVFLEPDFIERIDIYKNIDVGDSYIWALYDPDRGPLFGTQIEMENLCKQIISSSRSQFDDAALSTIILFCRMENERADVLKAFYRQLHQQSEDSANVWRDSSVFLPYVKRLFRGGLNARNDHLVDDIGIVTKGRRVGIYIPEPLFERGVPNEFDHFESFVKKFGLSDLKFFTSKHIRAVRKTRKPTWRIYGVGSTPVSIVSKSPFYGAVSPLSLQEDIVSYAGNNMDAESLAKFENEGMRGLFQRSKGAERQPIDLFISVSTSRGSQARLIQNEIAEHEAHHNHLVNIRPLGYGSPRSNTIAAEDFYRRVPNLDYVWIVGNHRVKRNYNMAENLTASSAASRVARNTAALLVGVLEDEDYMGMLSETHGSKGLGIVGTTRYLRSESITNLVYRALMNSICDSHDLLSARRIVAFLPENAGIARRMEITVPIARRNITVEIARSQSLLMRKNVFVCALDTRKLSFADYDAITFCEILLESLGGTIRETSGDYVSGFYRGELIYIWPLWSGQRSLEHAASDWLPGRNILVTFDYRQTRAAVAFAPRGWRISHYSELGRVLTAASLS